MILSNSLILLLLELNQCSAFRTQYNIICKNYHSGKIYRLDIHNKPFATLQRAASNVRI